MKKLDIYGWRTRAWHGLGNRKPDSDGADNTTLEKLKTEIVGMQILVGEECLGKFMNAVRAQPRQTVLFNGRLYRQMKISETRQGIRGRTLHQ